MKSRIASAAVLAICLTLLALPGSASAFEQISQFGAVGQGAGQVFVPSGMAMGPDGRLYVSDHANRVSVFAPDRTFLFAFGRGVNPAGGDICTEATGCRGGEAGDSAGAMDLSADIGIGPSGDLFVAAPLNNRIDVFSPDGAFIRAFGKGVNPSGGNVCTAATGCQKGASDDTAGSLYFPAGLDIDSEGTLYIADGNERVDIFSPAGTFLHAFGKSVDPGGGNICSAATGCQKGKEVVEAGGISSPRDIAVGTGEQVAVSNTANYRIDVFTAQGAFIRAFGKEVDPAGGDICTGSTGCQRGQDSSAASGLSFSTGLTVDSGGNIVAADISNNRIDEFTFDGEFIRAFGEGVIDGKPVFQVCTDATGCQAGGVNGNPGGVPNPFSAAADCRGAIYAATFAFVANPLQIKRFGEPDTEDPPCASAQPPAPPQQEVIEESIAPPVLRVAPSKPPFTAEIDSASGTATLSVVASEVGTLVLKGKGIRTIKRVVRRIGLVELSVIPKPALKRKLERAGKAKVKVTLTFTPNQGDPVTQFRTLLLERTVRS